MRPGWQRAAGHGNALAAERRALVAVTRRAWRLRIAARAAAAAAVAAPGLASSALTVKADITNSAGAALSGTFGVAAVNARIAARRSASNRGSTARDRPEKEQL
jgi:hypothetical protein